jgi:hypothetical protein
VLRPTYEIQPFCDNAYGAFIPRWIDTIAARLEQWLSMVAFSSQRPPPVRTKRKVVVDLLCLCIERSALTRALSVETVRHVVESALGEIYREGEFRLEPLWAILAREPGVQARDAAAALLAFKALEVEAELRIRLPNEVAALPEEERHALRGEITLPSARVRALTDELRAVDWTGAHLVPAEVRAGGHARALAAPSTASLMLAVIALAAALAGIAYLLAR